MRSDILLFSKEGIGFMKMYNLPLIHKFDAICELFIIFDRPFCLFVLVSHILGKNLNQIFFKKTIKYTYTIGTAISL